MDRFSKRLINRSPCSLFVFSKRPFLFKVLFSLWDVISSCAVCARLPGLVLSTCLYLLWKISPQCSAVTLGCFRDCETLHRDTGGNICFAVKLKSKGIAGFVCFPAFAVKAWCILKSCLRLLSGILGIFAFPLIHLTEKFFFPGDPDPVLRCIVSGFFANAAKFHSTGAYRWLYTVSLQLVLGWKLPWWINLSLINKQMFLLICN